MTWRWRLQELDSSLMKDRKNACLKPLIEVGNALYPLLLAQPLVVEHLPVQIATNRMPDDNWSCKGDTAPDVLEAHELKHRRLRAALIVFDPVHSHQAAMWHTLVGRASMSPCNASSRPWSSTFLSP